MLGVLYRPGSGILLQLSLEWPGPFHPTYSIGFRGVVGVGRIKVREDIFTNSKGTQCQTPAILKRFVHRKSALGKSGLKI